MLLPITQTRHRPAPEAGRPEGNPRTPAAATPELGSTFRYDTEPDTHRAETESRWGPAATADIHQGCCMQIGTQIKAGESD